MTHLDCSDSKTPITQSSNGRDGSSDWYGETLRRVPTHSWSTSSTITVGIQTEKKRMFFYTGLKNWRNTYRRKHSNLQMDGIKSKLVFNEKRGRHKKTTRDNGTQTFRCKQ